MAQSAGDLYQRALMLERANGKIDSATVLYRRVAAMAGPDHALAAHALLSLGNADEELGRGEARVVYERIVAEFGDQRAVAAQARERLAALSAPAGAVATLVTRDVGRMYLVGTASPDARFVTYSDRSTRDLAVYDFDTDTHRRLDAAEYARTHVMVDNSVVSPDSRTIAYMISSSPEHPTELRTISAAGGTPYTVPGQRDYAFLYGWTPDGKSVIERFHSGSIVRVDVRTGAQHELLKDSASAPIACQVSPDGKWLVADEERNGLRQLMIIDAASGGSRPLTDAAWSSWSAMWDPSGRGVVFLSDRTGSWGLWYLPMADGRASREAFLLHADIGHVELLGLSRDGRLFYRPLDTGFLGVDRVMASGVGFAGDPRMLVSNNTSGVAAGEFAAGGVWSPHGRRIAVIAMQGFDVRHAQRALRVIDVASGAQHDVPLPHGFQLQHPRWSNDGRALLVVGSGAGHPQGYHRIDLQDGRIETLLAVRTNAAQPAEWSADNASLFYPRIDSLQHSSLWRYDIDEAIDRPVYTPDSLLYVPLISASPDGRYLAFLAVFRSRPTSTSAKLITLATGAMRDLPIRPVASRDSVTAYRALYWLADGQLVGAIRTRADSVELWRIPADSGRLQKIVGLGPGGLPRLSPDGKLVALSERSTNGDGIWTLANFLPPRGR